jgi:hypothetical protein
MKWSFCLHSKLALPVGSTLSQAQNPKEFFQSLEKIVFL